MESKTLTMHKKKGIVYYTIPALEGTGLVTHAFTSKLGGVSENEFTSLNLGYNRGDNKENVDRNYNKLCELLGLQVNDLVFSDQIHEDKIYQVQEKDKGKGKQRSSDIKGIDALITDVKNVPLVTFYADCVPIFLLDPVKKAIGLAHAGWRGTVKKIGKKTIEAMVNTYGSDPSTILAGIAPSIGPCCFEVGKEVADVFKTTFNELEASIILETKEKDKFMIDLWQANAYTLLEAGVLEENITITDLCTKCHSDTFYSHRATGGKRGNLAAMMALTD